MAAREPITEFDTHAVTNQPPPLEQYNAFLADTALREAVEREGGGGADQRLRDFGVQTGGAEMQELAAAANRHVPEFRPFDRFGQRIEIRESNSNLNQHEADWIADNANQGSRPRRDLDE